MEERQQRWSQIESLCGLHIQNVSNHSLVTASESTSNHSRKNSSVAQALIGCANIGSVGSGRKLSSTKEPQQNLSSGAAPTNPAASLSGNLPPTYSTAVMESKNENLSSALLKPRKKDQSTSPLHRAGTPPPAHTTSAVLEIVNGHDESLTESGPSSSKKSNKKTPFRRSSSASSSYSNDGAVSPSSSNNQRALRPRSDPGSNELERKSSNTSITSLGGSPTCGKSRKRHSWFSRKLSGSEDTPTESETLVFENGDEESRHKKMKSLWKMAIRSSRVQRRQNEKRVPLKKESSEKLKAG